MCGILGSYAPQKATLFLLAPASERRRRAARQHRCALRLPLCPSCTMLCLAIVQLAARTGPSPSSQELSKLEPPSDDVPPGTTASQPEEQAVPESELPDLTMGIEELRGHPDWKRFPIDPVADAESAVSFCARNCSSIPRISFWDVPAPIMFERGATCRPSGCDWGTPTPTAEEQHKM